MAIPGYKCLVRVSGGALTLTDEPTTADAAYRVYQITDPAKQVLDPFATITVEVNGSPVSSGYKLDRLFGKVIFDSPLQPTDVVTVSGKYLPMATAAEAYELSYTLQAENADATRFQDTWVKRTQVGLDASGSFSQWFLTGADMAGELMAGDVVLIEYQVDNQVDLRAWALLSSTEPASQPRAIQTENIQWQGTEDADGRVVSSGNVA